MIVSGQIWKIWVSGGLLLAATPFFFLQGPVGRLLGISELSVELIALFLTISGLIWSVLSVRCPSCGLRLVAYAITKQPVGQWLQWLVTTERCPRCKTGGSGRL